MATTLNASAPAPQFYKPPRSFDLARLIFILPMLLLAAAILAAIYVYVGIYIEHDKLRILFTIAFGAAFGALMIPTLRLVHVYDRSIGVGLAALLGLFALYSNWVIWGHWFLTQMGYDVDILGYLRNPIIVWDLIRFANVEGTWKYNDDVITGPVMWTLWAGEAAAFVGVPIIVSSMYLKSRAGVR